MNELEFVKFAKGSVVDYFNKEADVTDKYCKISDKDVYIVWICKTLQNWKALLSTTVLDGMYYEFTLNGNKQEAYLDAYKKWKNVVFPVK